MNQEKIDQIENILAKMIDEHLEGLFQKIVTDFSAESFRAEISDLENDPVYNDFGLGSSDYALIRKVGRISISIGRRLGEIYDKIPRVIAEYAFGLTPDQVAPILGGKLELDTCIDFNQISKGDEVKVKKLVHDIFAIDNVAGIGIEIRYNFNPNDSSRLRKDEDMARLVIEKRYIPVYLVFSTISPRDEAIARLDRAGWKFLIGDNAYQFINKLYGLEFDKLFVKPQIKKVIEKHIYKIMKALYSSDPFLGAAEKYNDYHA
jgi:hypothetical protein